MFHILYNVHDLVHVFRIIGQFEFISLSFYKQSLTSTHLNVSQRPSFTLPLSFTEWGRRSNNLYVRSTSAAICLFISTDIPLVKWGH